MEFSQYIWSEWILIVIYVNGQHNYRLSIEKIFLWNHFQIISCSLTIVYQPYIIVSHIDKCIHVSYFFRMSLSRSELSILFEY